MVEFNSAVIWSRTELFFKQARLFILVIIKYVSQHSLWFTRKIIWWQIMSSNGLNAISVASIILYFLTIALYFNTFQRSRAGESFTSLHLWFYYSEEQQWRSKMINLLFLSSIIKLVCHISIIFSPVVILSKWDIKSNIYWVSVDKYCKDCFDTVFDLRIVYKLLSSGFDWHL